MKSSAGRAAAVAAATMCAGAADLPWPSGFDDVVAAREAAVLPVAVAGDATGLDLSGGVRRATPAAGSAEAPFDSWRAFSLPSAAMPFDTMAPGCLLFFR